MMKNTVRVALAGVMAATTLGVLPTAASAAEISCDPTSWRAWETSTGWRLDMSVPPPGVKVYADEIETRVLYTCPDGTTEFHWYGLSTASEADYLHVFPARYSGNSGNHVPVSADLFAEIKGGTYWGSWSTFTACEVGTTWYGDSFCTSSLTAQISHASALLVGDPRTDHMDLFPVVTKEVADPEPTPEPVVTPPVTAPVVTPPAPVVTAPVVVVDPYRVRAWTVKRKSKIKVNADPNNRGEYYVQLEKRRKNGTWKRLAIKRTTKTKVTFNPKRGTYRVHVLGWPKAVAYSDPMWVRR